MDQNTVAAGYGAGLLVVGLLALVLLSSWALKAICGPLVKIPGPFIGKWLDFHIRYHSLKGDRMQYVEGLH
jgi:hypothetical protein